MIDLHCHILPLIDDGAGSWDMSVQMCRVAVQDNIRHIVATPHANHQYDYDREYYENLLLRLRTLCPCPLEFSLGCDFHFSYDNIEDAVLHPRRYTIAKSNYLLIEFSNFSFMPAIRQGLFRLQEAGIAPIITHPERNPLLLEKPEHVLALIEYNCQIQVTAGSFAGHWGERSQRMAEWLLERDAIHVVASDAHDPVRRPPILSRAYDRVCRLANQDVAQTLFVENPNSIVLAQVAPPREIRSTRFSSDT
jgi:protein-tyrosine phosphatase